MSSDNFRFRNHYVPEHYLKQWAAGTSKIWTYRLLVPHGSVDLWKNHSLETIARRNHLYTRLRGGKESDELERWFCTDFESPASQVIDRIVARKHLSPEDWRTLARFVALQDVRTPARMTEVVNKASENLPDMLQDTLENVVEKIKSAKESDLPFFSHSGSVSDNFPMAVRTEFEPGAEDGAIVVETVAGRGYWLYAIEYLLTKTIKHLEGHRWTILRPPEGMKWLTSDNPVVKLNYYQDGTFDLKGGWGSAGSEIFLPLSPEYLLYTQIGSGRTFARGERLKASMALQVQNFIVRNAHRYIFSEQIDPLVLRIRPRTVSQEIVRLETQGWAEFHSEQTKVELALKSR